MTNEELQEIASQVKREARDLLWASERLRIIAERLVLPDLPEASRSSHHSG